MIRITELGRNKQMWMPEMLLPVRKNWPFFKTRSRGNGIKETMEWGEEEVYFKKKKKKSW